MSIKWLKGLVIKAMLRDFDLGISKENGDVLKGVKVIGD